MTYDQSQRAAQTSNQCKRWKFSYSSTNSPISLSPKARSLAARLSAQFRRRRKAMQPKHSCSNTVSCFSIDAPYCKYHEVEPTAFVLCMCGALLVSETTFLNTVLFCHAIFCTYSRPLHVVLLHYCYSTNYGWAWLSAYLVMIVRHSKDRTGLDHYTARRLHKSYLIQTDK